MSDEQKGASPLSAEALQVLTGLDHLQLAWLSGYAWARAQVTKADFANSAPNPTACASAEATAEPLQISVLSASQTGNAKSVADKLAERLQAEGVNVTRTALKDYKAKKIATEKIVLLVTSTQGEGEAPEEGVLLLKLLNGKKAPKLDGLQFAVLGLGDSSYPNFCQAGKDFDRRFGELGGERLLARVDADLDFNATADKWLDDIVALLKAKNATAVATAPAASTTEAPKAHPESKYSKENPFPAALITNQRITDRAAEKDVRHLEFDLSGSDLTYQAGDVLGVWFENDPALVAETVEALGLKGDEEVTVDGRLFTLAEALRTKLELTQNTPAFVKGYAESVKSKKLNAIVKDNEKLQNFVQKTPLVDVLHAFPAAVAPEAFVNLLRPLTPRLYSISSSPAEVGEEVHLSVGVVRFEHDGKARAGGASSYLADRVEEDGQVRVFVERNDNFRLPQDNTKPIIMIGSGTGIAPFRAFVQQRAADEAEGKNWLIFGNQHFALDFLYQTEWQQFAKDGFLHKYDFAWSRDQKQKIYVQDKIREQSAELWRWLQEGAYVYVCGDAARMAKDVDNALLDVIAEQGAFSAEEAEEYLDGLREDKRYQRDVY